MDGVGGYGLFLLGVAALFWLAWRVPAVLGLRGVDRLGAGILVAFAVLAGSAALISGARALTGVTWTGAVLAAACPALLRQARSRAGFAIESPRLTPLELLLVLAPAAVVAYAQVVSPVAKFDDLMYHGSRAGYWLGQGSVLPFPSHNERQTVLPYAGDLFFAFGVFTARSELAGKLLVFLAYPCVLALTAMTLRGRGLPATLAIGTAWVIAVTPRMREAAIGIKPDLWGFAFSIVAINAAYGYFGTRASVARLTYAAVLAGALCAAAATKLTFLLLAPLAVIPLIFGSSAERTRYLAAVAAWLVVFGLVVTISYNRIYMGGWFSSPAMSAVQTPDVEAIPRQLARLPFVLFGIPWIPFEPVRQRLEQAMQSTAAATGASTPLRGEDAEVPWPGIFAPRLGRVDNGYSLLWLFVVAGVLTTVVRRRDLLANRQGRLAVAVLGLGIWLMIGVTITLRWQAASGVPERFLLPGIGLAVLGAAWAWHIAVQPRQSLTFAAALLAAYHAMPFAADTRLSLGIGDTGAVVQPRSVLSPAARVVPPGSRVLLFASQDAGDYVLFHPERRFPTRVVPWGTRAFVAGEFMAVLDSTGADVVVFERPDRVGDLDLVPFVSFLDEDPDFRVDPRAEPNTVFVRHAATSRLRAVQPWPIG